MKRLLLYIGIAAAILGCTKSEELSTSAADGAISFSAGEIATRVTDDGTTLSWESGESIYLTDGSKSGVYTISNTSTGAMQFYSGQEFYTYGDQTQTFYGWSPSSLTATEGKLSLDLSSQSAVSQVVVGSASTATTSATFAFAPIYTKVVFNLTAGGADVTALTNATATLSGANVTGKYDYEAGTFDDLTAVDITPAVVVDSEDSSKATITVYVLETTSMSGDLTISVGSESFVTSLSGKSWAKGDMYEYNVTVGDVPAPKVGDYYYKDGTYSTENSATVDNPVIGVVFWVGNPTNPSANGSGLTFLGDATLAVDHSNCTNGLVVALNDVEENTLVWQSSYMDVETWRQTSSLSSSTFSVSTNGATSGETLNRIGGYNNSKVIAAFNAENADNKVSAYEKVETYALSNSTPASSSGWYLPSLKELFLLCGTSDPNDISMGSSYSGTDNRDAINTVLNSVSGASEIKANYYWPSTELNYEITCVMVFSDGLNGASTKGSSYRIRPVLAF